MIHILALFPVLALTENNKNNKTSACFTQGRTFNFCCGSSAETSPCGASFYASCCSVEVWSRESVPGVHVELTFEDVDEHAALAAFRTDAWLVAYRRRSPAEVFQQHVLSIDPEFFAPDSELPSASRFFARFTLRLLHAVHACISAASDASQADICAASLPVLQRQLQGGELSFFALMATNWPVPELLDVLQQQVAQYARVPADASCQQGVWEELWRAKDTVRSVEGGMLPTRLLLSPEIADTVPEAILARGQCPGGVFVAALMMAFITAQSEVGCVAGFTEFIDFHMKRGNFQHFLLLTAPLNFFAWLARLGRQASRHRMQHALASSDLRILGVAGHVQVASHCDASSPGASAPRSQRRGWTVEACRGACHEFPFFSFDGTCSCLGRVPHCGDATRGNATVFAVQDARTRGLANVAVALAAEPAALAPNKSLFGQLLAALNERPQLRRVVVTMVWGDMGRHLQAYAARAKKLGIEVATVVYALDDATFNACISETQLICIGAYSEGKSALQKYMIVLALLHFDVSVVWVDFDAVILKDPFKHVPAAFWASDTEILSSIDYDSLDCAMNAMFLIKPSEKTIVWLHALVKWIYSRPFFHCQHAWIMFLGLIEPFWADVIPKAPKWQALDPDVFANAAAFDGLGFGGDIEKIAVFHFFYGWNSGAGRDSATIFMKDGYKDLDMFALLYNEETRREAMEISRTSPALKGQRKCGGVFSQSSSNLGFKANCQPRVLEMV